MLAEAQSMILLVTHDRALIAALEPVFAGYGAQTTIADGWATTSSIADILPSLLLVDAELPESEIERILFSVRDASRTRRCRVVLLSDSVTDTWSRGLADGTIDDLVPRSPWNPHWHARLGYVLRAPERLSKLGRWRDASQFYEQVDPLTGLFNRSALLAALFRETDRVQRSQHALSVALFEIDDFEHWTVRFSSNQCNELLQTVAQRVGNMLRSYDAFGRSGDHEYLLILPGCSAINAGLLAERLLAEVFSVPVSIDGESIRLSACFGLASSDGRSPIVVLREAEEALQRARQAGPESIRAFAKSRDAEIEPIEFLL